MSYENDDLYSNWLFLLIYLSAGLNVANDANEANDGFLVSHFSSSASIIQIFAIVMYYIFF